MRSMLRTLLEAEADRLELVVEEREWSRLDSLVGLWQHYGRAMNLLGKRSDAWIAENVLEGLCVVRVARQADARGSWLDVGSGGGFPGLVVAASWEGPVAFVEPRERRAAFLERGLGRLGRRDCGVHRGRVGAQRGWSGSRGQVPGGRFSVVDARAVMPIDLWLEVGASWTDDLVLGHLNPESIDPSGWRAAARLDTPVASLRAYRAGDRSRAAAGADPDR